MSQKEFDRALFLYKVQNKQITLKKASELMHLSYPQTKRLWANYKKDGKRGLISKKRGRRSNRAVPEKERKAIRKIISGNYLNGRPISIYNDKRGTFVVNQGKKKSETQFSRAMKELGIKIIIAHSAQAKGRIERAFGTLQERLVWEMRHNRIQTMEAANEFLPKFIEEYNNKFSKAPSNPVNAHRPLNQNMPLKYILCRKEKRTVSKNLEIQYHNQIYQLSESDNLHLKRKKVTVITTLNKEIVIEYEGIRLDYVCYSEQTYKEHEATMDELAKNWKTKKKSKPSNNHPWKRIRRVA